MGIFHIDEIGSYFTGLFSPVKSKSGIHLRWPALETSDNLENLGLPELSRVSGSSQRKWTSDLDS